MINFLVRMKNALNYVMRGDFEGLIMRLRSINHERFSLELNIGDGVKRWCVLTTPHVLFIARMIALRLKDHGFSVDVVTSVPDKFDHEMYVVLCPQMFKRLPPGRKRIVFQLEQSVSSRGFTKKYFRVLGESLAVFDYSLININFLSKNKIKYPHVYYVPIGSKYGNFNDYPKKYDVIFYGDSLSSPRRREMLDIIGKKYNLKVCGEIFGEAVIEEIRSARVVINIHYYENALLEMPRIQECLALGIPVVSEASQDQGDYPEIFDAVVFFEQGNAQAMMEAIEKALETPPSKDYIAESVRRSEERFAFMFDRALVGLGLLPLDNSFNIKVPLIGNAEKIVISLPETINRRNVYLENKANDFVVFDGMRFRPGWIGCGLSYNVIARHAILHSVPRLAIIEDDVFLPQDFEEKFQKVYAYLDLLDQRGEAWHLFAGLVACLHDDVEIIRQEVFDGILFITLNKMTSMVCNIYSHRGLSLLNSWNPLNIDPETNTIDRHIENQDDLRVIVALPFLVGHREELDSTLWGFNNETYSSLISGSEKQLYVMSKSKS